MGTITFPIATALVLSSFFVLTGTLQLLAPGFMRRSYQRWEFPPNYSRVTGAIDVLAGCFLAVPNTRIWGVGIAAIISFIDINFHLARGHYIWLLPGLAVMAALPPVLLASTPF